MVAAAWQDTLAHGDAETCALRREKLRALPLGLQRGLLRRAIETLRPSLRDIGYETVERGLKFVLHPTRSGSLSLAQGLRLETGGELVVLSEEGALWADEPGRKSQRAQCSAWMRRVSRPGQGVGAARRMG